MSDKTNKNLKEAGLKATLPRIKILEILQRTSGTEDHFTAEEIYKELVLNNYDVGLATVYSCLLYTSPSPRDQRGSRMPSSA